MSFRTDPPDIAVRRGAYLPHWTREHAIYAVCFRLADSLPQSVLNAWIAERAEIAAVAAQQGRPLSASEEKRLSELHSERIDVALDAGYGACYLSDPRVAELVGAALRHFEGAHYRLHAWCVMPNHVHGVIEPLEPHTLFAIVRSWKSYTAKEANRILERTGTFWKTEYYDHLIRDASEFDHALRYIEENPVKAGLKDWPWVHVMRSSRPCQRGRRTGTGETPVLQERGAHGRDGRATGRRNS